MIKICGKCKIEKELKDFYKCKNSRDGLQHYCKECCRSLMKSYRRTDKNKKYRKEYSRTEKEKERRRKYSQTDKCKEWRKSYHKSEKYKKAKQKYYRSEKGKECKKREDSTPASKVRRFIVGTYRRLKKYNYDLSKIKRPKTRELAKILFNIMKEQPFCQFCKTTEDLTWDHIIPLTKGGDPFSKENLQRLCRSCNASKGNRL